MPPVDQLRPGQTLARVGTDTATTWDVNRHIAAVLPAHSTPDRPLAPVYGQVHLLTAAGEILLAPAHATATLAEGASSAAGPAPPPASLPVGVQRLAADLTDLGAAVLVAPPADESAEWTLSFATAHHRLQVTVDADADPAAAIRRVRAIPLTSSGRQATVSDLDHGDGEGPLTWARLSHTLMTTNWATHTRPRNVPTPDRFPRENTMAKSTKTSGFKPTDEQEAILEAVRQDKNLVIEAGAGTGKTSTLKLIAEANPNKKILYVAYNRPAMEDAQRRMPSNVTPLTSHALARRAVGRFYWERLNNSPRIRAEVTARALGITEPIEIGDLLLSPEAQAILVTQMIGKFCHSADYHLAARHLTFVPGLSPDKVRELAGYLLPLANKGWSNLQDPDGWGLRFLHDHYLKMYQLSDPKISGYDMVVVDEAQDTNPAVASIFRGQTHLQQAAVGDSNQSLYEWRGAVNALADWPADQRLFLSQSFRFGPAVAEEANLFLETLGAELRLRAHEGKNSRVGLVEAPDAVLCRTNATALGLAMEAMEQGHAAALVGRSSGKGKNAKGGGEILRLAKAVQELDQKGHTNHSELATFRSWHQVRQYVRDEPEAAGDLATMVRLIENHGVEEIIQAIDALVPEAEADVVFPTGHASKGREWNRVKIADDFAKLAPIPDPETGQRREVTRAELMLGYVSVTRGMEELDLGGLSWIRDYHSEQMASRGKVGRHAEVRAETEVGPARLTPPAQPQPDPAETSSAEASQPTEDTRKDRGDVEAEEQTALDFDAFKDKETADEPLRPDHRGDLAQGTAGRDRADGRRGGLPDPVGRGDRGADRRAVARAGRTGSGPGDTPGEVAAAELGTPAGGLPGDGGETGGTVRPDGRTGELGNRRGAGGERPRRADRGAGDGSPHLSGPRFRPTGQHALAPEGAKERVRANLDALGLLRVLRSRQTPPTADEQRILARWSGWGAVPQVFDPRNEEFVAERAELRSLLSVADYAAARRTTLNAHYTDASLVQAMWQGLRDLGFAGGNVLEPGCGSGNFIGFAPQDTPVPVHMVGVELDATTAAIASYLYPDAQVLHESFGDTFIPEGEFDAAVGNVPFGNYRIYDPEHNREGLSIHNHFISKALDAVKPGGVVAVITSHWTMDAEAPQARDAIAAKADLLGAIRLPADAHQRAAGTRVITDILVLRRRLPGQAPAGQSWKTTVDLAEQDLNVDAPVWVNQYFLDNPDHVLGTLGVRRGRFGPELTVDSSPSGQPLGERVRQAFTAIAERARSQDLLAVPPAPDTSPLRLVPVGRNHLPDGLLQIAEDGSITRLDRGLPRPYEVKPAKDRVELKALIRLRDTYMDLLDAEEASAEDTDTIRRLRASLNQQYDAYVSRYGPINRFKVDSRGGKQRPKQGGFRRDPLSSVVYALEHFNAETQQATKSKVFTQRIIAPRRPRERADSPADALTLSMDVRGGVDLDFIATLLGEPDKESARRALGTLVFDDPQSGKVVPAAEYLSGNVRLKLRAALTAAAADPKFTANVQALEEVQPQALTPADIEAKLGAPWIPTEYVEQFVREVFEDNEAVVEHPAPGLWAVRGSASDSVVAQQTYGTKDFNAYELLTKGLKQESIVVERAIRQGDQTIYERDDEATEAARAKLEELRSRFSEWIWEDPERAERLQEIYNDLFTFRLRSYDDVQLTLPGLNPEFRPYKHQLAAVARIIHEPSTLLAHVVGAGKTAEMVMGTMELRRLGLVRKPLVVVPNHMLEQVHREWLQLYPRARVLVADGDKMKPTYRAEFLAQAANGDWDAVVMTHTQLEKVPLSKGSIAASHQERVKVLQARLENCDPERNQVTVKALEKQLATAEKRLKEVLEGKSDPGLSFEQVGFDMLLVDEAHLFKNAQVDSKNEEIAKEGSNRAIDLMAKIDYLHRQENSRVVFATATPVANSVSEMWVMKRYLRPDLLAELSLLEPDDWAATFGEKIYALEQSIDGSLVEKQRFARFDNASELLRIFHTFADVKLREDLDLPLPEVGRRAPQDPAHFVTGPQVVVVPPTEDQYVTQLEISQRHQAAQTRGEKLRCHTYARFNALHSSLVPYAPRRPRLPLEQMPAALAAVEEFNALDEESREQALETYLALLKAKTSGQWLDDVEVPDWFAPLASGITKIDVAAAHIARIYHEHKDAVFTDPDSQEPDELPGAFQLVFCDLGVPDTKKKSGNYVVYDDLRDRLVELGVPREKIRFIQEARNDHRKKAELFASCRDGRTAVLIGSTEMMGVGTNVQRRAVALHHLECPWRPADIEQREGRIIRQGNLNPRVQILRYVTAGSYDAVTWDYVARKAGFIGQMMRGHLTSRSIEDIDDAALESYALTQAMAANNPLRYRYAENRKKLERLERRYRAWLNARNASQYTVRMAPERIQEAQEAVATVTAALHRRLPTRGKAFQMTVNGHTYTKRREAGGAIRSLLLSPRTQAQADARRSVEAATLTLGGFNASVMLDSRRKIDGSGYVHAARIVFTDLPDARGRTPVVAVELHGDDKIEGFSAQGLVVSLENTIASLDNVLAQAQAEVPLQEKRLAQAQAHLERPFTWQDDLEEARRVDAELRKKLGMRETDKVESSSVSAGDGFRPRSTGRRSSNRENRENREERGAPAPSSLPTSSPVPSTASGLAPQHQDLVDRAVDLLAPDRITPDLRSRADELKTAVAALSLTDPAAAEEAWQRLHEANPDLFAPLLSPTNVFDDIDLGWQIAKAHVPDPKTFRTVSLTRQSQDLVKEYRSLSASGQDQAQEALQRLEAHIVDLVDHGLHHAAIDVIMQVYQDTPHSPRLSWKDEVLAHVRASHVQALQQQRRPLTAAEVVEQMQQALRDKGLDRDWQLHTEEGLSYYRHHGRIHGLGEVADIHLPSHPAGSYQDQLGERGHPVLKRLHVEQARTAIDKLASTSRSRRAAPLISQITDARNFLAHAGAWGEALELLEAAHAAAAGVDIVLRSRLDPRRLASDWAQQQPKASSPQVQAARDAMHDLAAWWRRPGSSLEEAEARAKEVAQQIWALAEAGHYRDSHDLATSPESDFSAFFDWNPLQQRLREFFLGRIRATAAAEPATSPEAAVEDRAAQTGPADRSNTPEASHPPAVLPLTSDAVASWQDQRMAVSYRTSTSSPLEVVYGTVFLRDGRDDAVFLRPGLDHPNRVVPVGMIVEAATLDNRHRWRADTRDPGTLDDALAAAAEEAALAGIALPDHLEALLAQDPAVFRSSPSWRSASGNSVKEFIPQALEQGWHREALAAVERLHRAGVRDEADLKSLRERIVDDWVRRTPSLESQESQRLERARALLRLLSRGRAQAREEFGRAIDTLVSFEAYDRALELLDQAAEADPDQSRASTWHDHRDRLRQQVCERILFRPGPARTERLNQLAPAERALVEAVDRAGDGRTYHQALTRLLDHAHATASTDLAAGVRLLEAAHHHPGAAAALWPMRAAWANQATAAVESSPELRRARADALKALSDIKKSIDTDSSTDYHSQEARASHRLTGAVTDLRELGDYETACSTLRTAAAMYPPNHYDDAAIWLRLRFTITAEQWKQAAKVLPQAQADTSVSSAFADALAQARRHLAQLEGPQDEFFEVARADFLADIGDLYEASHSDNEVLAGARLIKEANTKDSAHAWAREPWLGFLLHASSESDRAVERTNQSILVGLDDAATAIVERVAADDTLLRTRLHQIGFVDDGKTRLRWKPGRGTAPNSPQALNQVLELLDKLGRPRLHHRIWKEILATEPGTSLDPASKQSLNAATVAALTRYEHRLGQLHQVEAETQRLREQGKLRAALDHLRTWHDNLVHAANEIGVLPPDNPLGLLRTTVVDEAFDRVQALQDELTQARAAGDLDSQLRLLDELRQVHPTASEDEYTAARDKVVARQQQVTDTSRSSLPAAEPTATTTPRPEERPSPGSAPQTATDPAQKAALAEAVPTFAGLSDFDHDMALRRLLDLRLPGEDVLETQEAAVRQFIVDVMRTTPLDGQPARDYVARVLDEVQQHMPLAYDRAEMGFVAQRYIGLLSPKEREFATAYAHAFGDELAAPDTATLHEQARQELEAGRPWKAKWLLDRHARRLGPEELSENFVRLRDQAAEASSRWFTQKEATILALREQGRYLDAEMEATLLGDELWLPQFQRERLEALAYWSASDRHYRQAEELIDQGQLRKASETIAAFDRMRWQLPHDLDVRDRYPHLPPLDRLSTRIETELREGIGQTVRLRLAEAYEAGDLAQAAVHLREWEQLVDPESPGALFFPLSSQMFDEIRTQLDSTPAAAQPRQDRPIPSLTASPPTLPDRQPTVESYLADNGFGAAFDSDSSLVAALVTAQHRVWTSGQGRNELEKFRAQLQERIATHAAADPVRAWSLLTVARAIDPQLREAYTDADELEADLARELTDEAPTDSQEAQDLLRRSDELLAKAAREDAERMGGDFLRLSEAFSKTGLWRHAERLLELADSLGVNTSFGLDELDNNRVSRLRDTHTSTVLTAFLTSEAEELVAKTLTQTGRTAYLDSVSQFSRYEERSIHRPGRAELTDLLEEVATVNSHTALVLLTHANLLDSGRWDREDLRSRLLFAAEQYDGQALQGVVRIDHTAQGTRLYGVAPDDSELKTILRECKFKRARGDDYYYLPRPWKEWTRQGKVDDLIQRLDIAGHPHISESWWQALAEGRATEVDQPRRHLADTLAQARALAAEDRHRDALELLNSYIRTRQQTTGWYNRKDTFGVGRLTVELHQEAVYVVEELAQAYGEANAADAPAAELLDIVERALTVLPETHTTITQLGFPTLRESLRARLAQETPQASSGPAEIASSTERPEPVQETPTVSADTVQQTTADQPAAPPSEAPQSAAESLAEVVPAFADLSEHGLQEALANLRQLALPGELPHPTNTEDDLRHHHLSGAEKVVRQFIVDTLRTTRPAPGYSVQSQQHVDRVLEAVQHHMPTHYDRADFFKALSPLYQVQQAYIGRLTPQERAFAAAYARAFPEVLTSTDQVLHEVETQLDRDRPWRAEWLLRRYLDATPAARSDQALIQRLEQVSQASQQWYEEKITQILQQREAMLGDPHLQYGFLDAQQEAQLGGEELWLPQERRGRLETLAYWSASDYTYRRVEYLMRQDRLREARECIDEFHQQWPVPPPPEWIDHDPHLPSLKEVQATIDKEVQDGIGHRVRAHLAAAYEAEDMQQALTYLRHWYQLVDLNSPEALHPPLTREMVTQIIAAAPHGKLLPSDGPIVLPDLPAPSSSHAPDTAATPAPTQPVNQAVNEETSQSSSATTETARHDSSKDTTSLPQALGEAATQPHSTKQPRSGFSLKTSPPPLQSRPFTPLDYFRDHGVAASFRAHFRHLLDAQQQVWADLSDEEAAAELVSVRDLMREVIANDREDGATARAWAQVMVCRSLDPVLRREYADQEIDLEVVRGLPEGPTDTDQARRLLAKADAYLTRHANSSAEEIIETGAELDWLVTELAQKGLWHHGGQLIRLVESSGLKAPELWDLLNREGIDYLHRHYADEVFGLLLADASARELAAQACGRARTANTSWQNLDPQPGLNYNSTEIHTFEHAALNDLLEELAVIDAPAALAVIVYANQADVDPTGRWDREELRSRLAFPASDCNGRTLKGVRITHTANETRVHGVDRTNPDLVAALKGFTYNEDGDYYTLNSHWKEWTRQGHVDALIGRLEELGYPHLSESWWQALAEGRAVEVDQPRQHLADVLATARAQAKAGHYGDAVAVLEAYREQRQGSTHNRRDTFGTEQLHRQLVREGMTKMTELHKAYQQGLQANAPAQELLDLVDQMANANTSSKGIDFDQLRAEVAAKTSSQAPDTAASTPPAPAAHSSPPAPKEAADLPAPPPSPTTDAPTAGQEPPSSDSQPKDGRERADRALAYARQCHGRGEYGEALRAINAAAQLDPTRHKQWQRAEHVIRADQAFAYAGARRQAHAYDEALRAINAAAQLDPTRAELWHQARQVVRADQACTRAGHLMRTGRYRAALTALKEANRLDPSRSELWDQRRQQVLAARQAPRDQRTAAQAARQAPRDQRTAAQAARPNPSQSPTPDLTPPSRRAPTSIARPGSSRTGGRR